MNARVWAVGIAAVALMVAGGGVLTWAKGRQRLGLPGVRTTPIAGTLKLRIDLPERVFEYTSTNVEPPAVMTNTLPQDTSIATRHYVAPDGFAVQMTVVLMGTDRTSIHKPEFCLTSQGWQILARDLDELRLAAPRACALPVQRFTTQFTGQDPAGRLMRLGGVYVFWFVAENRVTASHTDRVRQAAVDLLSTGVMPRWAYVGCFAACAPGREAATAERLKRFLAAAVPEFQTSLP